MPAVKCPLNKGAFFHLILHGGLCNPNQYAGPDAGTNCPQSTGSAKGSHVVVQRPVQITSPSHFKPAAASPGS